MKRNIITICHDGHLKKYVQELKVDYFDGKENTELKDFTRISIKTSNPGEISPRSFGTNDPNVLRNVIKALCKCLNEMELKIKG